jgi:hypothetical protein
MSNYVSPRSVTRLEEELAELEKAFAEKTEEQVVEEEVEEGQEVVQEAAATTPEEETWKKRHGDLRRLSQKQAEDLKKANARLAALEKEGKAVGLPSAEEAEEWAKANPKAASIIRALANEQTTSSSEDLIAIKKELEKSKQEVKIKKVHSDFEEVTSSDEFHDWAESQTQSVQNLIYEGDSDDIIWAISLYKKEAVVTNPNKDAARNVSGKKSNAPLDTSGDKKFSESQVQKMLLSDYEKNEEAIKKSMKLGTFIYDLSGAAR